MSNAPPFYYNHPPNATGVTPSMMGAPVAGRGMSPAQMGLPYMQQGPFRNMGPDPSMHRKRAQNKTPRQGGGVIEDGDEPSGDELDDISARDIAMARYKRNHDYLSEIFTPYNASSITPPPLDVPQSKDELNKLIEEEQKAIEARNTKHQELLKSVEKKRDSYWEAMSQLDSASTTEDMSRSTEQFERMADIKVEHTASNVHTVQIPGLEPEQPSTLATASSSSNNNTGESGGGGGSMTPAQVAAAREGGSQSGPTNMDLFQSYPSQGDRSGDNNNANQHDDDNSNDFFNEMVNTGQEDDGGSVSEFLNTGDMDFEPNDKQDGDSNNMTEEQQRRD
ncbi:hypothetical protein LRAMOSA10434 [Lichtheimia ramosa]|uniref:SWI/SNF and RSC complexes subunit Ssr4 C-terminal domain-containing protein n=1 Tax=Lichtheimia ramosa TaxID=688394 RepID=A0A077WPN7_9FUNG|nr:hypothetical protein LRAMOSA10434 [Lichtheimia ramosa]